MGSEMCKRDRVTISDTDNSSNGVSIADLNTLDDYTTGTIDAATITVATGTLAALLEAYGSNGITGLGNENLIVTDTGSLSATDLNSLDSKTSGTITTHTSLATLTGTLATLNAAYASGIDVLGNEAIVLTDSAVDAEDLNILNNYTTGNIDADNILSLIHI